MTKLYRGSLLAFSLCALAGCAAPDDDPIEAPPPAPPAHGVVGTFAIRIRPGERRADVRRVSEEVAKAAAAAPGFAPQNFDDLPVVSDGTPGSGPDYSVELATDENSLENTYNKAASGTCPANSFCGDVTFTHFYPGLNLSGVYVQIYNVTIANNQPITGHDAANGEASTPFGIDLTRGAWLYTNLGWNGTTASRGVGVKKRWALKNPDNQDTVLWVRVLASLYPMVWLSKTGVTQTAPLVAGKPASIHYEYARNTTCRGSNWSMNAFLKGNGIDTHQMSYPGVSTDTYFDVHTVMPFSTGVDMWFNSADGSGCAGWDSNGGSNYNFGIQDSNIRIHFTGPSSNQTPYWTTNWSFYADSGVKKGATVTLDYEINRVLCGSLDRYGRVPSGTNVTMYYWFDNGAPTSVSLLGTPYGVPSSINGVTGRVFVPPVITIPTNASKMTMYFDSTSSGCQKYDSNFSNNFVVNNL